MNFAILHTSLASYKITAGKIIFLQSSSHYKYHSAKTRNWFYLCKVKCRSRWPSGV